MDNSQNDQFVDANKMVQLPSSITPEELYAKWLRESDAEVTRLREQLSESQSEVERLKGILDELDYRPDC